ncbi:MAG: serine hydrolase [Candidatus Aminicenantes bacterium]|nr:serine hydrolase [Candidatus Aminicenantes bacterium]
MRKALDLAVLVLLGFTAACDSRPVADIGPKIDAAMARFSALEHFSGTVLVARGGRILYAKAFGQANKDLAVANAMNTRFEIGSIAKLFTGTAVIRLVERGRIGLEDPVIKHLPEFPFGDRIEIIHLLTHTSGLPEYHEHPRFMSLWPFLRSIDDFLPMTFGQKLKTDTPGNVFSYCSAGFQVLGAVLERVGGRSYKDCIREEILEPCGMTETSLASLEDIVPNRAVGYMKNSLGGFKTNAFRMLPFIASAGIQTTAGDLLKFDRALAEGKLLSQATLDRMTEPYLEKNWGIVWRLADVDGRKVAYHGGETDGVSAMFRRYLEDDLTLIVLSNYHRAARPVAAVVEAIMFGKPYEMPRPTVPEFLYAYMTGHGGALPEGASGKMLEDNGHPIPTTSGDLNGLGYELLEAGTADMAVQIFLMNTRLFPKEANSYDSLAEAYEAKGDTTSAVRCYRKALEIDPNLKSSKAALERLEKK